MISQNDIQYMRKAHREIYEKRMKPVLIVDEVDEGKTDPFGQPIKTVKETEVMAVVTYLSAYTNTEDLGYFGYVYQDGDTKFDVDEEFYPVSKDLPTYIEYEGIRYHTVYGKPKGIGVRNRTEFIGRRVT